MSNLRTVASILVVCIVSLLTGFLIFPETASGYPYTAYVSALKNQYMRGEEIGGVIGVDMQNKSIIGITKFLSQFNQAVRKNPSLCNQGRSYYGLLDELSLPPVGVSYIEFIAICR